MRVIVDVEARIAALLAEAEELKAFLSTYKKLYPDPPDTEARSLPRFPPVTAPDPQDRRPSVRRERQVGSPKRDQMISALMSALSVRQPQKVPELLVAVKAMGIEVGGKDEEKNLSTYLSRSDYFRVSRKDGGWFLDPPEPSDPMD